MKRRMMICLSILLVIGLLSATTVFAEAAPDDAPELTGSQIDLADADAVPEDGSYTLMNDGEAVLEVSHVQAPGLTAALSDASANGFYTAEFMIPETNFQVFLTGLTLDNVSEIRQAIVESYTEDGDFDLKNLGFIDTEKTWAEDNDDNLCWAATSSNLLTYTGWAAQAGFATTDDLFEAFINSFTDEGGNVYYGSGWFFNGVAGPAGSAQPTPGTGRYLPQYSFMDMVEDFDLLNTGTVNLRKVEERLHNGYGAALNLDIYRGAVSEGGHAVSCWGFVTDIRYPEANKLHYKSVFITDSDSDKYGVQNGKDRREADDVMSLYALEPFVQYSQEDPDQTAANTYTFRISTVQTAVLSEAITVAPYSPELPYETDTGASMNPSTDVDLTISPFYLSSSATAFDTVTVFSPDDTIYNQPRIFNNSEQTFNGPYSMKVVVKDAQGNVKKTKNYSYGSYTLEPQYNLGFGNQSIGKLPVGDYTVTATVNPNKAVTEAFYFNNVKTIHFKVREKYLLGDADNDGEVNIIDVTTIQRILAKFNMNVAENVDQRGDINESGDLDLLDATLIQWHLSNVEILYEIDLLRFYN